MRAMLLTGHGDVDQYVHRDDVPVPEPRAGEVLVAVEACSVNNTDINVRTNWYAGQVDDSGFALPRIQGADVAGRIAAVGESVDPSRVGERILVDPGLRWEIPLPDGRRTGFLGFDVDGGYAQFVRVPAGNAWKVGETLSAAELACLPVAYTTALEMILRAQPLVGETIVVTGASGGVGVALVQLAKLYHLRVIAVASAEKADRVRELGADVVIDRAAGPVVDNIRAAGFATVDIVADVTGGETLAQLIDLLRPRGRAVTAGAISGAIAPIDLRHMIYKDIALHGVSRNPDSTFASLIALADAGLVRPPIAATFPLPELGNAHRAFLAREQVGKVVVLIDQD